MAVEWKVTIFTKSQQTQLCLVPSVLPSFCSSAISLSEVCFNNPQWHSPVSAVGGILFDFCLYGVVEKQRKMLYHDKSDILKFSDRDSAQKFIWFWLNSADRWMNTTPFTVINICGIESLGEIELQQRFPAPWIPENQFIYVIKFSWTMKIYIAWISLYTCS